MENGNYRPSGRNVEIGLSKLTPELIEEGFSKADVLRGDPAVILYPKHLLIDEDEDDDYRNNRQHNAYLYY